MQLFVNIIIFTLNIFYNIVALSRYFAHTLVYNSKFTHLWIFYTVICLAFASYMTAFNTVYELRTSPKLLSFLLLYTNMHTYIKHTHTYTYRERGERERKKT